MCPSWQELGGVGTSGTSGSFSAPPPNSSSHLGLGGSGAQNPALNPALGPAFGGAGPAGAGNPLLAGDALLQFAPLSGRGGGMGFGGGGYGGNIGFSGGPPASGALHFSNEYPMFSRPLRMSKVLASQLPRSTDDVVQSALACPSGALPPMGSGGWGTALGGGGAVGSMGLGSGALQIGGGAGGALPIAIGGVSGSLGGPFAASGGMPSLPSLPGRIPSLPGRIPSLPGNMLFKLDNGGGGSRSQISGLNLTPGAAVLPPLATQPQF